MHPKYAGHFTRNLYRMILKKLMKNVKNPQRAVNPMGHLKMLKEPETVLRSLNRGVRDLGLPRNQAPTDSLQPTSSIHKQISLRCYRWMK